MKRTREGRREGEKGRGGESYQAKTTSHPRPGSRRSRGNPFNIIFNLALNRLAVSASRVEKLALASLKPLSLSLSLLTFETRPGGGERRLFGNIPSFNSRFLYDIFEEILFAENAEIRVGSRAEKSRFSRRAGILW